MIWYGLLNYKSTLITFLQLSHLLDCEDVSELFLSCWSLEEGKRIQKLAEQCTSNNRYTRPTTEKVLSASKLNKAVVYLYSLVFHPFMRVHF